MGYLRKRQYGDIVNGVEKALRGAADGFVAKLATHLRHEEEVLFPALRKADPEAGPEIERLEEEHRLLRVYATDLACRISKKDTEGAYEVSRAFLAALFDHIDRERKSVDERLKAAAP
jgi:hemerythrin-like domain-containing protein